MANVRKWLSRILVALFCICSVGSMFLISASASDITEDDAYLYRYFSCWTGTARISLTDGTNPYTLYQELPFALFEMPKVGIDYWTSNISYGNGGTLTDYDEVTYGCYGRDIAWENMVRWRLGYRFGDNYIASVRYDFEPINFYWNSDIFNSLFVVGNGEVKTSGTLTWFDGNVLHERAFSFGRTIADTDSADGVASPLTASQRSKFETEFGLNSSCYCELKLRIDWTPSTLRSSCYLSVPVTSVYSDSGNTYPLSFGTSTRYFMRSMPWTTNYINLYNSYSRSVTDYNTLKQQYDELVNQGVGMDFTGWLAQSVGSVLSVPIFGSVTIGHICYTILAFAIVLWLLKLFAGG